MAQIRVCQLSLPRYIVGVVAIVGVVLFSAPAGHARRFDDQPQNFSPLALEPDRGYFSQFAWEHVDLVNGNLLFNVPILELPGNAGMDLKVHCSFNMSEGWRCGLAGVPLFVLYADGNLHTMDPEGEESLFRPVAVEYDGANHTFLGADGSAVYWRGDGSYKYTAATHTLELPNGWIASYDPTPGALDYKMLVEVHDAFGNQITPHWEITGPAIYQRRLLSVDQSVGGDTRTVGFGYNSGVWTRMDAVTFYGGVSGGGDRTWWLNWGGQGACGLTSITPPAGPSWNFNCTFTAPTAFWPALLQVVVPTGGAVSYTWEAVPPNLEDPEHSNPNRLIRTTSGPWVTGGTWTFNYDHSRNNEGTVSATVDLPGGRHLFIKQKPANGAGAGGPAWVTVQKILSSDSEGELSRVDNTWTGESSPSPRSLLATQVISQGGLAFSKVFEYHDFSDHRADYGTPYRITETGPTGLQRVTTRQFTYDFAPFKQGVVESETVAIGGDTVSKSYTYDSSTAFMTQQTVAGVTTTFSPAAGNPHIITDALGHATTIDYQWGVEATTHTPEYTITRTINPDGTLASEARNGNTTQFGYDAAGRPTSVTPPLGAASYTYYYQVSDVQAVQRSRGDAISITYLNGFGQPLLINTSPDLHKSFWYDAEGRKTYDGYPYSDTIPAVGGDTFTYDGLNRVTSITHPDQSVIYYGFSGTSSSVTDENGHTTTQHHVAFGGPSDTRLASVVDAAGQTWAYSYNVFGSLTRVDQPTGPDRVWAYDSHNWLASETQPESGTTTYNLYDAVGNLKQKTDARGYVFNYVYDGNNRLTVVESAGVLGDKTFQYNNSDQVTASSSGGIFVQQNDYDAAGRPTLRSILVGGSWFYTYFSHDGNDRLTRIQYARNTPGAAPDRVVDYAYDSAGRVTSITGPNGATYADQIAYRPSGAVASMHLGNGQVRSVTYDVRHRPIHLTDGPVDLTYGYDNTSNVTSIADGRPGHSATYGFDALDRLSWVSGVENATFTYDALGNRLTRNGATFAYDPNTLRLATVSGGGVESGNYGYDATGNMTADPSGTYGYDEDNRLYEAVPAGQGTHHYYFYDSNGQRIVSRTQGTKDLWTFRGLSNEALTDYELVSGTLTWTRDSVYLGSQLIATVRPAGVGVAVDYAHSDVLGSVRATTDQAGNVLARHDYGAFGEDMGPGPATGPERQRFTGKERDSETFFDYYGARYYRNVLGRFTTADWSSQAGQPLPFASLTNPQSINLYSYAYNNPLRYTDPDGHCVWDLCIGEGAAVYVGIAAIVTTGAAISANLARPEVQKNLQDVGHSINGMLTNAAQKLKNAVDWVSKAKRGDADEDYDGFIESLSPKTKGPNYPREGDALDNLENIGKTKGAQDKIGQTKIDNIGKAIQKAKDQLKKDPTKPSPGTEKTQKKGGEGG